MYLDALAILFEPMSLVFLIAGVVVGFLVGVLPGLSTSNTAALLLPFSVGLPTEHALVLIVSIYAGAAFGGSVPAILVNVPGEAGSAVTALDGYQLAKQGKAGIAIGIARMSSTLGGVISGAVVLVIIAPLGALAMRFGAREMFLVVVLGIVIVSTLIGKDIVKGLCSGALGLLLATVGGSPLSGQSRFTFGEMALFDGIQFVPALIGLFAISEMLLLTAESRRTRAHSQPIEHGFGADVRDAVQGARETFRHPRQVLQSTGIGMVLGIIPGIGNGVANFVSYGVAKRTSKHPERFGTGAPEGVVASEACDNALAAATLVPTLALGVPGSATMAVILAQLYIQGIQPGPRVLETHGAIAIAAIMAIVLASILILPIGVLATAPLVKVTRVPLRHLVPVVLVLAITASYGYRGSLTDAVIAVVFGIVGFIMRLHGFPVIPLVLGLVLGPLAEEHLSRALLLANGDPWYFMQSPTAIALWLMLVALIAFFVVSGLRQRTGRSITDAVPTDTNAGGSR